jgi:hypothetical protein
MTHAPIPSVPRCFAAVACALFTFVATKARGQNGPPAAASDPARTEAAQPWEVAPSPASASLPEPPFARVRYAFSAEPAFGVGGGNFYNQLVGARIDYRFTPELALGGYVGYANLKGKDGRAHDVLPYVNLEYRPRLGQKGAFGLPLGFGTGYLPNNGPLLRLSAGVSYAVGPETEVVFAFFTPTFWVVHDRTVISLGAAFEVSYAP